MKYKQSVVACALLMLFFTPSLGAAASADKGPSKVQWQIDQSWKLKNKPLDIVYSLDGKRVFILTDDANVQVFDPAGTLLGKIPVTKGVSAIDIAPRGEKLYLINEAEKSFTSLTVSFVVDIDITGSPFLGKEDAPVTIVVFTDFECPYCSKAVPILEQIMADNPETVKIVLKNMPLSFHKFARPAAMAALAAANQGKFWEFHDALFSTPKLSAQAIKDIAVKLKLDIPKFEKDMRSPQVMQRLTKDMRDAKEVGVSGTPTIFINGMKLQERSVAAIQKIIDEDLAQKAKE